jgi:hypothetical protein
VETKETLHYVKTFETLDSYKPPIPSYKEIIDQKPGPGFELMSYASVLAGSRTKLLYKQPSSIRDDKTVINHDLKLIKQYTQSFGVRRLFAGNEWSSINLLLPGKELPDINTLLDRLDLCNIKDEDFSYSGPVYEKLCNARKNVSDALLLYQHRAVMYWISSHSSDYEHKVKLGDLTNRYMFVTNDGKNPMKILTTAKTEDDAKLKIINHLMTQNALDLTGCYCQNLHMCKDIVQPGIIYDDAKSLHAKCSHIDQTEISYKESMKKLWKSGEMNLSIAEKHVEEALNLQMEGSHIFFNLIHSKLEIVLNDTIVVSCLDG